MAELKPYVAVQEFILNLDNGKSEVRVNRGDIVEFDGLLTAKCKDHTGQARSLVKVIREGEWLKPIKPENIPLLQQRLAGKALPEVADKGPVARRNVTGGRLIENSDPSQVKIILNKNDDKELIELINNYEKQSSNGADPLGEHIKNSKESSEPAPRVIKDDENVVAIVKNDKTAVENSGGVIMGDDKEEKLAVVTEEERVVKNTAKKATIATKAPVKKPITIIRDTDSKIVKKTGPIQKGKIAVTGVKKASVSNEERVVSITSYENDTHTDVGSSTQVSVEMSKNIKKVVSGDSMEQDAVVVGKGTVVNEGASSDGIIMNNSVGAIRDEDFSNVTVSSGGQDIEQGEAYTSSGSTSIADLAGDLDDAGITVVSSEGGESVGDTMDIDISDLIG